VANRLYGEQSYDLRAEFLALAQGATPRPSKRVDFRGDAEGVREHINDVGGGAHPRPHPRPAGAWAR
jgi:hypothetical protein